MKNDLWIPKTEERKKAKDGLTMEQKKLKTEWKKDVKDWKQGEAVTKQQIASSILDSLFMKVRAKGSAYDIWTELGKHFKKRSRMVSIDLRQRLQELRCAEKGNIIEHFAVLRTMREDLASMGRLSEVWSGPGPWYSFRTWTWPSTTGPVISRTWTWTSLDRVH